MEFAQEKYAFLSAFHGIIVSIETVHLDTSIRKQGVEGAFDFQFEKEYLGHTRFY